MIPRPSLSFKADILAGFRRIGEMTAGEAKTFDIRGSMIAAHGEALASFVAAGTWLDGKTRRALVQETRIARRCQLCTERRAALSWAAVAGTHRIETDLSAPYVELAHRMTTDPGRVANDWFEALREDGVSAEQYVEAAGLVGTATVTDTFATALFGAPTALQDAGAGEPTQRPNPDVVDDRARVPLMDRTKPLAPFNQPAGDRPMPNIVRALALVPDTFRSFWATFTPHYRPREVDGTGLGRPQIEFVASRTSALNECFY